MRFRLLAALAFAVLSVAGCGDEASSPAAPKPALDVVATTTQATDLVTNVGGDRVDVHGLIPANADPHDYEVRPADIQALTDADLVVRSGGDLDEWLGDAIENAGADAPVMELIGKVRTQQGGQEVDPHWWHDPANAALAVTAIRDALIAADPAGRAGYQHRATTYLAKIDALDRAIKRCMATVPKQQRKLVTTHDALGYYAKRYGIEVIGTVIPSTSTAGQASAGEIAELVATIKREKVKTIFAESSVNPKIEAAIAKQAGARVGPALYSDTLGEAGSSGNTYLKALAFNTRALVEGFSGGAETCSAPS